MILGRLRKKTHIHSLLASDEKEIIAVIVIIITLNSHRFNRPIYYIHNDIEVMMIQINCKSCLTIHEN
jgi:hypothetical protein